MDKLLPLPYLASGINPVVLPLLPWPSTSPSTLPSCSFRKSAFLSFADIPGLPIAHVTPSTLPSCSFRKSAFLSFADIPGLPIAHVTQNSSFP